jgi:alkylation response protein AidB-like acyl-CoA dehydrogenase
LTTEVDPRLHRAHGHARLLRQGPEGQAVAARVDTSELVLEDVRVGDDALLPKSGGLKSPLMCLTQARYGIAFGVVGAAMACSTKRFATRRNASCSTP